MRLTLSNYFNFSSILRQDKKPDVKVNVDQPKYSSPPPSKSSSSSTPPPRVDVKISPPKSGGVPAIWGVAAILAVGAGGYWYFTSTKKGEQAVVDAKGELEKAKISAKYAGGDALDKAKNVAHDKLDNAKDAAKDGLDKAKGYAKDKLDDAKKALK